MNRRLLLSIPWVLAAFAAAPSSSQEPPEPSKLTEEVTVRLVQVPVTATNRQGHPIADLTADEIRVKDGGKKMKVAFLDPFVRPAGRPLPATRLFIDAPGGWHGIAKSTAAEPRYLALVVDVDNDPPLRRDKALTDAIRFVQERMTPETQIAVFSYDGELNQELLFTPELEAVQSALATAFSRAGRPDVELGRRMKNLIRLFGDCVTDTKAFVSTASEQCLRSTAIEYADERRPRAEEYVRALDGLLRFMGGIQGRKVIYALSHGVAADSTTEIAEALRAVIGNTSQVGDVIHYLGSGEGARGRMDRLLDLALREGVVVNFVDRSATPTGDFQASLHDTYQPGARPMEVAHAAPQEDLKELAATTGGSFVAEPDVFKGLSRVSDLEAGSYILGYYVDRHLPPERLRKVSISAERGGVKIMHRRGQYDQPQLGDIGGKVLLGQIGDARPDPADGTPRPENAFVPFQVIIDPRGLRYAEAADSMTTRFTLHVQIEAAGGRITADGFRFIDHAYPLSNWQAGDIEPVRINGWAELPPGRYRLIALVRNPETGHRGELSQIIDIPERATGG